MENDMPGGTQASKGPSADPSPAMADRMMDLGLDAADRIGELSEDAREAIRDNPWAAAAAIFGVGLLTGAALGVLLRRD